MADTPLSSVCHQTWKRGLDLVHHKKLQWKHFKSDTLELWSLYVGHMAPWDLSKQVLNRNCKLDTPESKRKERDHTCTYAVSQHEEELKSSSILLGMEKGKHFTQYPNVHHCSWAKYGIYLHKSIRLQCRTEVLGPQKEMLLLLKWNYLNLMYFPTSPPPPPTPQNNADMYDRSILET